MRVRRILASVAAAVMVAGGVSLAVAPAASAVVVCPTLSGTYPFTVTPAPSAGVDWSGCDLSAADLSGADLSGANLSGANLSWANLDDNPTRYPTDLSGANLTRADLSGAFVDSAILAGAFVTCSDTGVLGTSIADSPDSLPSGWTLVDGTLTVPIVACPPTDAPADAPPIPAWGQAYGRDGKDATCEKGWSPSWQKWAEPVTGGWVCTRDIPSLG